MSTKSRVSDPNPFFAVPDPGFEKFDVTDLDKGSEKFANPDPGFNFCKKFVYLRIKAKKSLSQDQNADPDRDLDPGTQENADPESGTPKMRIQSCCGSGF